MNTLPTQSSSPSPFKYRAFISYSHQDRTWGDWLHHKLETYKPHRHLLATDGSACPRRIYPVFRDREELPTSSDLGEVINRALEESEHLIVICSPRSATSIWVNEEIRYFKSLGREDKVLCLIVDGEPNATDRPGSQKEECFPPAVRHRVGTDGQLTETRTEPIAGDAREQGDGKNNAFFKLVAGLLHVDYAKLNDREQKRNLRRKLALVSIAALLLVIITGIWAIQERRRAQDLAEEQARTLAAYAEAERQRAEAERQKEEAQRNLATSYLNEAMTISRDLRYPVALKLLDEAVAMLQSHEQDNGLLQKIQEQRRMIPEFSVEEIPVSVTFKQFDFRYFKPYPKVAFIDDHTLATADDGSVAFFDLLSFSTVKTFETSCHGVASSDGSVVLGLSYDWKDSHASLVAMGDETEVSVFEAHPITGYPVQQEGWFEGADFSGNGDLFILAENEYSSVYRSDTRELIGRIFLKFQENDFTTSCMVSGDGSIVAIGKLWSGVHVVDLASGREMFDAFSSPGEVTSVVFTPDNAMIAWSAHASDQNAIYLADLQEGSRPERVLLGEHDDAITDCVCSPLGQILATASLDGTIKLWNWKTREMLAVLETDGDPVRSIAFSPDGTLLAAATQQGRVMVWTMPHILPLAHLELHVSTLEAMRFSPDGMKLITSGGGPTLGIWNTSTWHLEQELSIAGSDIRSFAISPDNQTLVLYDSGGANTREDGMRIVVYDMVGNSIIKTLLKRVSVSNDNGIFFSKSQSLLISLCETGITFHETYHDGDGISFIVFDASNYELIKKIPLKSTRTTYGALIDSESKLAVFNQSIGLQIWSLDAFELLSTDKSLKSYNNMLSFNDGTLIFANTFEGALDVHDTESGQIETLFESPDLSLLRGFALSADGSTLAFVAGDMIQVHDLTTHQLIAAYPNRKENVDRLCLSGDGSILAASHLQGDVIIWRIPR